MTNGEVKRQPEHNQMRQSHDSSGGGGGGGGGHFQFQMPVHYPRYTESDYKNMPEWQLDRLLSQYGLTVAGSLSDKRSFAIGTFLWH